MLNDVVDGHIVSHVRYGLLFTVYRYDDFQLNAMAAVQAGNCKHFNNPDMKSSFFSLGKPRGNLLMQEEESPEAEERHSMSIEGQAWVGLPLVQILVHESCPHFGGVCHSGLFQVIRSFHTTEPSR